MVLKSVKRIKETIPEIIHIAMFYDDGTVFQSTFDQPINVPKLGENLSEGLKHINDLLKISQFEGEILKKSVHETDNLIIIVLKLGEQSNLALFFKKGAEEPDITPIRRYIQKIENLIDTDKKELDLQILMVIDTELSELERQFEDLNKKMDQKKIELSNLEVEINECTVEMNKLRNLSGEMMQDPEYKQKIDEHESKFKKLEIQRIDLSNGFNVLNKESESINQKISTKMKEKNELLKIIQPIK
ncbi:MAG: hypothetical protein EAX96_02270 [Candidatus Lokiarchaeota archaeon]|nr:hypothetical protein [Candidatus Lokiarchaeota archaeon]